MDSFDLIVVGSGAAGLISAIKAARDGKRVLLLEKLSKIAAKLKATGGGRCNLSNTLSNENFMERFGREGRFMRDALERFDYKDLRAFFLEIGVETHAPDGHRIFPISHQSVTIIAALKKELEKRGVTLLCSCEVQRISHEEDALFMVSSSQGDFWSKNIIIATGGLGYPVLGAQGDGYRFAASFGHKITDLSPAMMPLKVEETWVGDCRADTIAKVEMRVDLPKSKKLRAKGDLIFTKNGIRGPVVLDFARFVTPLLKTHERVPIVMNLTKGMHEEEIINYLKNEAKKDSKKTILEHLHTVLPLSVAKALCWQAKVDTSLRYSAIEGFKKNRLIKLLAWTPLHITGHDGFEKAMITRGGVSLKEIDPKTMQSKRVKGLYFCGEVMDLDGPCGGFNLQWSFSSGYLAGSLSQ
ncbi:NAD(P)/FAD-dependent oxidoreductase [Sulfurospirillum sp. 1612]|uniref:NAD(P)/FAD-dependent oxidoreductase n=1 Tax=Sulfurospirillum sp. 1612 TaxID=3094835 RepID=UPI002F93C9C5